MELYGFLLGSLVDLTDPKETIRGLLRALWGLKGSQEDLNKSRRVQGNLNDLWWL